MEIGNVREWKARDEGKGRATGVRLACAECGSNLELFDPLIIFLLQVLVCRRQRALEADVEVARAKERPPACNANDPLLEVLGHYNGRLVHGKIRCVGSD